MSEKELTPMMRQYRRIKQEIPEGAILMFRLGDFYEMFFEDASIAAPALGLTLTKRNGVPMCGVPYHAIDSYLAKMVRAGMKAAICEQMENPAETKGIVRREVTRIITPGTVTEAAILDSARNNFLAAMHRDQGSVDIALLDLSTGEFTVETFTGIAEARDMLRVAAPSETLVTIEERAGSALDQLLIPEICGSVTEIEDWTMRFDAAQDALLRHFSVQSLFGFGIGEGDVGKVCAAGALLQYVSMRLRHAVGHIRSLRVCSGQEFVTLDETTCYHLDMLPQRDHPLENTLLGVLDATRTNMGRRLLRNWLVRPLRSMDEVCRRHDAVDLFTRRRMELTHLRSRLSDVRDLERLISHLGTERGNARDARALASSLSVIPELREALDALAHCNALSSICGRMHALPELVAKINDAICDEPALQIREGGIIRDGYCAELDELRDLASSGHKWLAEYQTSEQERTGIKSLKIRHNRVTGFYIEVSKGQLDLVPEDYERRQTLVNAERFVTPELKQREQKIFGATDRAHALEYELFKALRIEIAEKTDLIQETAQAIAELDVLMSFADRALALGYVRPEMMESGALEIAGGRHPVIEQLPDAEAFVPNDTLLDDSRNQIMLITGPNMAGKSTYIRQVALIVIMAHIGSFVSASSARIPLVDRVFTRIGAGDDLARGRSTFMVEMQETANILNNATRKSLIVLDEIGRGTSTFDGISIAWAVAEFLHNTPSAKAKTLFATHYHELTDLEQVLPGVRNYTVLVRESGDGVIFLRRIAPGTADKSYGIQVAALAGMPPAVVSRSKAILKNLEDGKVEDGMPKFAKTSRKKQKNDSAQLTLF